MSLARVAQSRSAAKLCRGCCRELPARVFWGALPRRPHAVAVPKNRPAPRLCHRFIGRRRLLQSAEAFARCSCRRPVRPPTSGNEWKPINHPLRRTGLQGLAPLPAPDFGLQCDENLVAIPTRPAAPGSPSSIQRTSTRWAARSRVGPHEDTRQVAEGTREIRSGNQVQRQRSRGPCARTSRKHVLASMTRRSALGTTYVPYQVTPCDATAGD